MRIQIIHDDCDLFGMGKMDVYQLFHATRPIEFGVVVGDLCMSPT